MNYIERYWRDAKPEDAIKEPPMVARFRIDEIDDWSVDTLQGLDRSATFRWIGRHNKGKECQVYDAPDPGEGWRLIDPASEKWQEGDEFQHDDGMWDRSLNGHSIGFSERLFYRRRITPAVTYVPFTWEDREQLRGRVIVVTWENGAMQEFIAQHFTKTTDGRFEVAKVDADRLVKVGKFLDTGKPVGKEIAQ